MRKIVLVFVCFVYVHVSAQSDTSLVSFHFQATTISQWHPQFHALYEGDNSLESKEPVRSTLTNTLFLAIKPWKNGVLIFNPEVAGGEGFSGATGLAGFSNGESFRVGNPRPTIYLARLLFQQTFALAHSDSSYVEDNANVVRGFQPADYIKLYGGRFCLADYFDGNPYNHDPRSQFMNWSFMSAGAWDYAADTRGYTWGIGTELKKKNWRAALAFALLPRVANGIDMDENIGKALASQVEVTHYHSIKNLPGQLQATLFYNRAQMGNYTEAIKQSPARPDIEATRDYKNSKWGWVVNGAQQLSKNVGSFLRLSWNDGRNETWAYTEIDRSLNAGITINTNGGADSQNAFGAGVVLNGLSKEHKAYLASGGYGFIIGDGRLNYAPEIITELFYRFHFFSSRLQLSPNYQFAVNPAYNKDRGPVHIFSLRAHIAF